MARGQEDREDQARQTCHGAQSETNALHAAVGRLFEGSFRQALSERHQAPRRTRLFSIHANRRQLETRDRVRSIGEQVCDYADLEGDSYNPFRACKKQLTVNVSTPRPGVTEAEDVVRLFKLINQRREERPIW